MVPDKYFDQLANVLEKVPPLPGEETLYAQFRQLLNVAAKNPKIKQLIVEVAKETEESVN